MPSRLRHADAEPGGRLRTAPVMLRDVTKLYGHGRSVVRALGGVSAEFTRYSFTAVMGPSGSGKSTLLHCAAGLERPTSGTVWLAGRDIGGRSEKRLTELRRSRVGSVFQALNLVPALSVRENVVLPLRLASAPWDRKWVDEVLGRVGLEHRVSHRRLDRRDRRNNHDRHGRHPAADRERAQDSRG
jgi:putative ABC transport system ATP-binding protein